MSEPLSAFAARPVRLRRIRRRRTSGRLLLLAALAVLAFVGGSLAGAGGGADSEQRTVLSAFAAAWERGDERAMYRLLGPAARRRASLRTFTRVYEEAAHTTTATRVETGAPALAERERLTGSIPVTITTRTFGTLTGVLVLPLTTDPAGRARIDWMRHHVHPGLARGQELTRETAAPTRARLLARDGTVIAARDGTPSPVAAAVAGIAGSVGTVSETEREALLDRGFPADTPVGLSGLERQFELELAGDPGGSLRAGGRLIARTRARKARDVRTSIDPEIQAAAVTALAGRVGGVAVVRPRTGEVLALAGLASSSPQPPGSTFKVVTVAAALQGGAAKAESTYPVETKAVIEGVELANHDDEACGGSLTVSFAKSCNSVFAPLGVQVGAKALVSAAERFGFNEDPGLSGALPASIPQAGEIGDDLAVGASAIGQAKVLATPLTMAGVASAIAMRGRRARPTLKAGGRGEVIRATTPRVARIVGRMMRAVVSSGTGTLARIEGVTVAGKTGTAELRSRPEPPEPVPGQPAPVVEEPVPLEEREPDTDAWFAAYAPAGRPRVAIGVFLLGFDSGGDVAAPLAREVLVAALRATR